MKASVWPVLICGPLLVACADQATCDAGTSHFISPDGRIADWTSRLSGNAVLDEPGTLELCEGTWSVALQVASHDVAIIGQGAERTVLEAHDAQVAVVRAQGVDGLVLQGLTVRGGSATFRDEASDLHAGAGVNLVSSSAQIIDAEFADNVSSSTGGAVRVEAGALTLRGSTFHHNDATMGAAVYLADAELTVWDTTFRDNVASIGAAISGWPGTVHAYDIRVEGSVTDMSGAGVSLIAGSHGVFFDSVFRGNRTDGNGGAMGLSESDISIRGCTFEANEASSGGALHVSATNLEVAATDFIANTPTDLFDAETVSASDLGLGATLTCDPEGCT